MLLQDTLFGKSPVGREARMISIETQNGLTIVLTNCGGIITSIKMPD